MEGGAIGIYGNHVKSMGENGARVHIVFLNNQDLIQSYIRLKVITLSFDTPTITFCLQLKKLWLIG